MKKGKILFCTDSYKTGRGGVASYAHDFVQAFKNQYEFIIVTNDDYQDKEDYPILHIQDKNYRKDNIKKFLSIVSKTNPDIIINSAFPLASISAPYLPNDVKLISISHFTDGRQACAAGVNAQYADSIVALSTFGKSYIDEKFKIRDFNKTKIVYNSMPKYEQVDIEKKKKAITLKIVYPGGCAIAKSAEIVCHALKLLLKTDLDFEFYWLGRIKTPGANWPGSRIKKISDVLNSFDSRIKHIGPVPREESIKIIAEANIFLLPSRGEGCPITLLEAMRSGCIPVISNAKHGSLDIIEDKKTGFIVKQGSPNAIIDCLKDIIENHKEYGYIYDNTYTKFMNELEYDRWVGKMNLILNLPCSHEKRSEVYRLKLFQDTLRMRYYYKKDWFLDRVKQLYHFIYFIYIRYFV